MGLPGRHVASPAVANFVEGKRPGWGVASQLQQGLHERCPRLKFSVYADYSANSNLEAYHIIAKNPQTNAILFRRLMPVEALMNQQEYDLLMAQLYLVEPPT